VSAGIPCQDRAAHRSAWQVQVRKRDYHGKWSAYSLVRCTDPGCCGLWRTKAAYVDALPDLKG
jgi:hypothetical protein